MKKYFIIFGILILIVILIFIFDNSLKGYYEDPLRVGKTFSYGLLTLDSEIAKQSAFDSLFVKIDSFITAQNLDNKEKQFLGIYSYTFFDHLELCAMEKLLTSVIATYKYEFLSDSFLTCTVVLTPSTLHSYWESFKEFIFYKIPLGEKIVGYPRYKWRWDVIDFYTDANIKNYLAWEKQMLMEVPEIDTNDFQEDMRYVKFEDEWAKSMKIQQYYNTRKLWLEYKSSSNPKE